MSALTCQGRSSQSRRAMPGDPAHERLLAKLFKRAQASRGKFAAQPDNVEVGLQSRRCLLLLDLLLLSPVGKT